MKSPTLLLYHESGDGMSDGHKVEMPGAPSLRVLCARVGFHNCLIHGSLIARCPCQTPTAPTSVESHPNVEERDVRMGHPAV